MPLQGGRTDTPASNHIHRRPLMRPEFNWKTIALIPGVPAFGACVLVRVGLVPQAFGFEQ